MGLPPDPVPVLSVMCWTCDTLSFILCCASLMPGNLLLSVSYMASAHILESGLKLPTQHRTDLTTNFRYVEVALNKD